MSIKNTKNTNILFVLSQNEIIMNAVKSSNLVNIFKNIIFIEEEMYMNDLIKSVVQPVGYGGSIISIEKIKIETLGNEQRNIRSVLSFFGGIGGSENEVF